MDQGCSIISQEMLHLTYGFDFLLKHLSETLIVMEGKFFTVLMKINLKINELRIVLVSQSLATPHRNVLEYYAT